MWCPSPVLCWPDCVTTFACCSTIIELVCMMNFTCTCIVIVHCCLRIYMYISSSGVPPPPPPPPGAAVLDPLCRPEQPCKAGGAGIRLVRPHPQRALPAGGRRETPRAARLPARRQGKCLHEQVPGEKPLGGKDAIGKSISRGAK